MKKRPVPLLRVFAVLAAAIILFCICAAVIGCQRSRARRGGGYAPAGEARTVEAGGRIGTVVISTLPLSEGLPLNRASFTPAGRVIFTVRNGKETSWQICDDSGENIRLLCTSTVSYGNRLLPFADNRRVLVGDYVLECPEGQTLDTCDEGAAVLVPILFPEEFHKDPEVTDKWTEVIIAPDCEHFAWTIRRSDCGAVNAMGTLVRTQDGYEVTNARYISNMNAFTPGEDGTLLYTPVIGGEVKQFVHGGAAISLVGAASCGMADSVIQDIATGEVTQVTYAPGYDETAILSPDEQLAVVMTTRFSAPTDPAVLGLVPRPFGQPLHNILGQVYMYSVTGVRRSRAGNIGPALIDLSLAKEDPSYLGVGLHDPEENWIFNSPLSWNGASAKAMWLEREKNGSRIRVQIAALPDYTPGEPVAPVPTPEAGDYGTKPAANADYSGRVEGKAGGYAEVEKKSGFAGSASVRVTYHGYSDDGLTWYEGTESSSGSILTKTRYSSHLTVQDSAGAQIGGMDVDLTFGPAYKLTSFLTGSFSPELDTRGSRGSAFWQDREAVLEGMVK